MIRRYGADTATDVKELWRRLVFNILISNLDDHLRNHGFLYAGGDGWRLSPAYDINPQPRDLKPRFLTTTIAPDGDASASIELALSVARGFGVLGKDAQSIAGDVATVVQGWRRVAADFGLARVECDRMASAFEHEDAEAVRRS